MSDQARRKTAKTPISAHPAFPAIVALWFAALLGLGSLVLPISLFERLSEATGISSVAVAAQPPLGVTARIFIALVGGLFGAIVGIAVARRVVAANMPRPATRREAAARPISAHEELGRGGLDAENEDDTPRGPIPGRRRALSVTDDSARSEFLDLAPLPGQLVAEMPAHDPEPLDLAAFDAEPAAPQPETPAAEDTGLSDGDPERRGWADASAPFGSAALSGPPVTNEYTVPLARQTNVEFAPPAPEAPPAAEVAPVTERPLASLGMAELVERFAAALGKHRSEREPVTASEEAAPVLDVSFAFAAKAPSPAPQTSARFESAPQPVVPAALRPLGFDDLADDSDDDEADLGLTLAARPADRPFATPVSIIDPAEDEREADQPAEENYSSLLAMKGPAGLPREPVRIEDEPDDEDESGVEPVVVFPGQMRRPFGGGEGQSQDTSLPFAATGARPFDAPAARADAAMGGFGSFSKPFEAKSGDTERALRDALEKLQKMSGAA